METDPSHVLAVKPALGAAERNCEKRLLRDTEAAAILGICRRTFYRLWKTGAAPAGIKLLKSHRWDRQVLDLWISQGCPVEPHIDAKGQVVAHA